MSRIPDAAVREVLERAGGYCEACGMPRLDGRGDTELHHRQARGMGGSKGRDLDVAINLLALHPQCHGKIHGHPRWSRDHGFIVPSWADPAGVKWRVAHDLFGLRT